MKLIGLSACARRALFSSEQPVQGIAQLTAQGVLASRHATPQAFPQPWPLDHEAPQRLDLVHEIDIGAARATVKMLELLGEFSDGFVDVVDVSDATGGESSEQE